MSANSTSFDEPLKAIRERKGRRREMQDRQYIKNGQRKETNIESGARHRIFGDGLRSMGSARVVYPMHLTGGTLHQSGLGQL